MAAITATAILPQLPSAAAILIGPGPPGPAGADATLSADALAALVHAAALNTDPQDDDELLLLDSNTYTMTKLKYSQLQAANATKHASLTVGAGNSAVTYEAVVDGSAGAAISVAYATAAVAAATTVALTGSDFVVTPGTKARMVVTGTLYAGPGSTNPVVFPVLLYNETLGYWTEGGSNMSGIGVAYSLLQDIGDWSLFKLLNGESVASWYGVNNESYPDAAGTWNPSKDGTSGTPTITAGTSSAYQVALAVTSESPSTIVATPTDGTGVGSVVNPFTHTHLTL